MEISQRCRSATNVLKKRKKKLVKCNLFVCFSRACCSYRGNSYEVLIPHLICESRPWRLDSRPAITIRPVDYRRQEHQTTLNWSLTVSVSFTANFFSFVMWWNKMWKSSSSYLERQQRTFTLGIHKGTDCMSENRKRALKAFTSSKPPPSS